MKVSELIERLQKFEGDTEVKLWTFDRFQNIKDIDYSQYVCVNGKLLAGDIYIEGEE